MPPPPPPLSKPQPFLPIGKTQIPMRCRAQPVAPARSARLDDVLSAGFVRLLNAGHEEVGRSIRVCITRLDVETNDLIISGKKAWEMSYLKEGTLLQGNVRKIFPYGAQVRITGTNRSGLLHISNISRGRVVSVSDILKVDDEVKILVVKSNVPDKIAVSIADLESAPGLFLSDKEVFSEAEEMAKMYWEQLPVVSQNTELDGDLPGDNSFDDGATLYANRKWFRFLKHGKPGDNNNGT